MMDTQRIEAIQRIIAEEEFATEAVSKICEVLAPTSMADIATEIRFLVAALDTMVAAEGVSTEHTPSRGRIEFAETVIELTEQ
ncbi:hypothetical protein AB0P21_07065 [Kribbella sp. NPDC056861]|uniref:hypothetical protein n=1 Tax=Kribbella sp. NPDC056861 TaxID=3154857 RepID=UPI00343033B5